MSEFHTNIETQDLVYKYLERPEVLYEFLVRAEHKKLGEHITEDITTNNPFPGFESITIDSEVKKKSNKAHLDIYIVIKFSFTTDKNSEIQFGHATFHLIKQKKRGDNLVFGDGPMHIVNDRGGNSRQRRWKFRVNRKVERSVLQGLIFSVGSCSVPGCSVQEPIPSITNSLLNVLNKYFDPTDTLSLTHKLDPSIVDPELQTYTNEIIFNNVGPIGRRGGGKTTYKKLMFKNRTRKHK
jgi:hypothetical protein